MAIPKIIHLMWFGGGEYPRDIKKCIESWKSVLSDYEIKVWDYEMANAIDIQYLQDALKARKWAFAADVVRLYALYTYGGVYMDADVFVKSRFDEYMHSGTHFFQEYHADMPINEYIDTEGNRTSDRVRGCGIQAAFMISEKENECIKCILDTYKNKHFTLDENGRVSDDEFIAPDIYAIALEKYGYKYLDIEQTLKENVYVHPSCYVAGGQTELSIKSFAIHQCAHSWYDFTLKQKIVNKIYSFYLNHLKGKK